MSRPSSPSAATRGDLDDTPTRIEPSTDDGGPTTPGIAGPPPPAAPQAPPPLRIGRYTVLRRLGQGGMGVVYAAYDDELDRRVAIKLLLSRPEEGSMGRARLQREAQALAKLSHPNVVQVYETGSHDDQVYLVMEYVEGPTLRGWLEDARPSWSEIVDMYLEIGKGLAAAHRAGLIHRDFKPVNVIVGDDGRPRILDFGLARAGNLLVGNLAGDPIASSASHSLRSALLFDGASTSLSAELTQAGTLLGTPAYMAPEQLFLAETDARADIYAFAVSLWEALYAARPYPAKSVDGLRAQVRAGPPPPPPKGRAPAAIGRVLRRALAFDRDDRFATMELFLVALEAAARRRRRLLLAAAATLSVAALLVVAYVTARSHADDPRSACASAGETAALWDPERAAEVEAAITGTGLSYGAATWATIEPRLDSYAEALAEAQVDACVARYAHRDALPPALREQVACLDRRRVELETVVRQLAGADAKVVEHAVSAVAGLSPLARCADLERLAADALRRRLAGDVEVDEARWSQIERLLVEAQVAQRAERLDRGHALATQALEAAEAVGARPLAAAALLRLGALDELRGNYKAARERLHAALIGAEAVGDDPLAADVALELLRLDGVDEADASAAQTWGVLAEAKLARAGENTRQRILLALNRAIVGLETGDRELAAAAVGVALELVDPRQEAYPKLYISTLNVLSTVQKSRGELAEGEATLRGVLDRHIQLFGEGHPYQAMLVYNIGVIELMRHEIEAARASFEASLAAREAAFGPTHPEVAQSLNGLAAALLDLGREAEAIPLIERSMAIDEAARGDDHPELIYSLNNLADALKAAGRADEAEPHLRRALAILEGRDLKDTAQAILILSGLTDLARRRGDDDAALALLEDALARGAKVYGDRHPTLGALLHHRGQLLLAKGDAEGAEASVDAALAQLVDRPDHRDQLSLARVTKADLMWADRRRRGEATAMILAALAAAEAEGADAAIVAPLKTWLKEHPR